MLDEYIRPHPGADEAGRRVLRSGRESDQAASDQPPEIDRCYGERARSAGICSREILSPVLLRACRVVRKISLYSTEQGGSPTAGLLRERFSRSRAEAERCAA